MRKIFYLAFLSLFVGLNYSCSSNDDSINNIDNDEKGYEVSINMTGFSSEVSEFRSATSTNNIVKNLSYQVYDITNNIIVEEKGLAADTVIQNLSIKLKKGNYKVSVFASDKALVTNAITLSGEKADDWIRKTDQALAVSDLSNPNIYQGSVDVAIENANVSATIQLTRPIGKISLKLSDLNKIPATVQSITPVLARVTQFENVEASKNKGVFVLPQFIEFKTAITTYLGHNAVDEQMSPLPLSSNVYQSVTLERKDFSKINANNSFDFYLPQTTNTRRYNSESAGYDVSYIIYLIGSKTEYTQVPLLDRDAVNENIVFMIPLAKNIQIEANKQIVIQGKIFADDQLDVLINDIWGETIDNEFE